MASYDKYINSTGTHYIANSGSDERGKYNSGQAGDQTGKEAALRAWYSRPWTVVLRYPSILVGTRIAELSCAMCLNNKVGYDQYQRLSYWKQLQAAGFDPAAIDVACEQDCTAGVTANVKAAGHLMGIRALEDIEPDTYSGNMRARFVAAGFVALTGSKYTTGTAYLQPGDILLYEGHHAACNVTWGKYATRDRAVVDTVVFRLGDRILKNGMQGDDVKALQSALIRLGFGCGPWGADGDFGDATEMAVRHYQIQHDLTVDGHAGPQTIGSIKAALGELDKPVENPTYVGIHGGNCYVRTDPSTDGDIMGIVHDGAKLPYAGETAANGWHKVRHNDRFGWVSGKYGRLER